ncbi:hypothetical protein N665_0089s0071 [Sinapis alba]|nr:hypothetical protein N665_0089s0071 [Sinapis alba]
MQIMEEKLTRDLQYGASTAFYHMFIKTRQSFNQITILVDEHNSIIDSISDIKNHNVCYFQSLLGGCVTPSSAATCDIASMICVKCYSEAVSILSAPFSDLDIKLAFFSLPKNKAPRPDGYPAEFFTANWEALGCDMISAIKEFLTTGRLLQQ